MESGRINENVLESLDRLAADWVKLRQKDHSKHENAKLAYRRSAGNFANPAGLESALKTEKHGKLPLYIRNPREHCWQVSLEFGPHSFVLVEYKTEEPAIDAKRVIEENWCLSL